MEGAVGTEMGDRLQLSGVRDLQDSFFKGQETIPLLGKREFPYGIREHSLFRQGKISRKGIGGGTF